MRVLLDTHVWLWGRLEPERLGSRAREIMSDPHNELWLSPVSVWEALMLIEKGRLIVDAPARNWVADALRSVPLRECPLTHEVALSSRSLPLSQDDPADRFLAATAVVYNLILLTADRRLLGIEGLPSLQAD